jgi:subfamily B ATP-binding cassette protein MsbA
MGMTASAIYKRLLAYAAPYWRVFVITALAMILFAATDTGFAALMKPMLDGNFIEHDADTVKFVPLALLALFLFRGLAGFLSRYGMSWIGRRVIQVLRRELFHQLLRLPAKYFDRNPSGRLLSRLTFDVEQVAEATANAVTILIRDSMTLIFLLAYMFWISGWLTLLFLFIGPVLVVLIRAVSRRFRSISRRIQDSMGELTQFSEEVIHGQRLIKSFTGEQWQETLFEQVNERNRKLHLKMAAALGASTPIVQFIAACILALVIYLATLESVTREISVGSFVSFIAAAYDRAKGDVLKDVSFSVLPGQTVALVGRSGSGKTTLANLLVRFYEPRQGAIYLDGEDIRDYRLADLRRQIALVGQDVTLFNDSIAHNIAYGRLGEVSDQSVIACAEAAHAMQFITDLPEGINSRIGDRGVLLSGGQRQRVAIARAMLKDAPILVLDEATSALDSESERMVKDALEQLTQNRTSLIIAHRLSTVERADRILVLEKGRIVETGSHAELLATGGVYADLYRLQFKADSGA